MTWKNSYPKYRFQGIESLSRLDSFPLNEQCFIRKDHKCGKIFGASKSCFIACPKNDELEVILELMSEKLTKVGIEPIIAVKERVYGQDIFCTKICGRIIESRFCVVILDDNIVNGTNIPNPNVYYEYGLMTSLKKHIIPLQKEDLDLAFNIQSYDTIKYKNETIGSELDRAIKDAIRITEKKEKEDKGVALPEKTLLRKLEMVGFNQRDDEWFLYNVIEDTNFKGFGQDNKDDKPFYLYLGKIDNTAEFQDYLSDLGIVIYRTEHKAKGLQEELSSLKERLKDAEIDKYVEREENEFSRLILSPEREIIKIESDIKDITNKLFWMSTMFVGFIINPQLDTGEFLHKAEELIQEYDRYKLSLNSEDLISFDNISVTLSVSST
jgi:hypothetical protein